MDAEPIGTKPCIRCAHDIPGTAKRCEFCGAEQDWRRFFTLSNTTLSLLVALIAVATPLVGFIYQNLSTNYAAVSADILAVSYLEPSGEVVGDGQPFASIGFAHSGMNRSPVLINGISLSQRNDGQLSDEDFVRTLQIYLPIERIVEAPSSGAEVRSVSLSHIKTCPISRIVANRDFQNDSYDGLPRFQILVDDLVHGHRVACSVSYQYYDGTNFVRGENIDRSCTIARGAISGLLSSCTDDRIWRY